MQTTGLKSVLLSKADIAQIAKEFKKRLTRTIRTHSPIPTKNGSFGQR